RQEMMSSSFGPLNPVEIVEGLIYNINMKLNEVPTNNKTLLFTGSHKKRAILIDCDKLISAKGGIHE
ncbi:MAG: hypothetical protein GY757_07500, partial [bacterium]|nr:hypothetical protein [bacterium]